MALNIKDRRTDALAREAAMLSQTTITEALREALEEKVVKLRQERDRREAEVDEAILSIQRRAAAVPDRDARPLKEMSDWLWDDGEGVHPARLNLADCAAYALARSLDASLLYKGDDFTRTDVVAAVTAG